MLLACTYLEASGDDILSEAEAEVAEELRLDFGLAPPEANRRLLEQVGVVTEGGAVDLGLVPVGPPDR